MQTLDALSTSFSQSTNICPFEVVFGTKPNGITKIWGEADNEVRLEDHVHRKDEGIKAILEENLSKTREKTDERSAETQQPCEEIKRNHDAFVEFSTLTKETIRQEQALK